MDLDGYVSFMEVLHSAFVCNFFGLVLFFLNFFKFQNLGTWFWRKVASWRWIAQLFCEQGKAPFLDLCAKILEFEEV
jgi:hypothetical protein